MKSACLLMLPDSADMHAVLDIALRADLGADRAARARHLYSLGARADWLGRPADATSSIAWCVYAGIGTRRELKIPR